jgi:hypothetical protein
LSWAIVEEAKRGSDNANAKIGSNEKIGIEKIGDPTKNPGASHIKNLV